MKLKLFGFSIMIVEYWKKKKDEEQRFWLPLRVFEYF